MAPRNSRQAPRRGRVIRVAAGAGRAVVVGTGWRVYDRLGHCWVVLFGPRTEEHVRRWCSNIPGGRYVPYPPVIP